MILTKSKLEFIKLDKKLKIVTHLKSINPSDIYFDNNLYGEFIKT